MHEFQKHKHNFLRRVDEYYKTRSKDDLDNIAKAIYGNTSGDMREMWGRKWYELIKHNREEVR